MVINMFYIVRMEWYKRETFSLICKADDRESSVKDLDLTCILFNRLWNSSGVVTSTRFSSQEKQGFKDIVRDAINTLWLFLPAQLLFKAELFVVINDEVIAFGTIWPLIATECTYFLGIIDFILTEINAEERRVKTTALWSNMIIYNLKKNICFLFSRLKWCVVSSQNLSSGTLLTPFASSNSICLSSLTTLYSPGRFDGFMMAKVMDHQQRGRC